MIIKITIAIDQKFKKIKNILIYLNFAMSKQHASQIQV